MPGRRCSSCKEVWPQSHEFNLCPRCESGTIYDTQVESPYSRDEALAIKLNVPPPTTGTAATTASILHAHRVERYLELGFSEVDAQVLAVAKYAGRALKDGRRYEFPLDWQLVAKALKQGATHTQAVAVFA